MTPENIARLDLPCPPRPRPANALQPLRLRLGHERPRAARLPRRAGAETEGQETEAEEMNDLAIAVLKIKSVWHFEAHQAIVRRFRFAWLAHLCSKAARGHRKAFNSTMAHLAKLDPDNCPGFRL